MVHVIFGIVGSRGEGRNGDEGEVMKSARKWFLIMQEVSINLILMYIEGISRLPMQKDTTNIFLIWCFSLTDK